jgi:uncharacterized caspase-like protein
MRRPTIIRNLKLALAAWLVLFGTAIAQPRNLALSTASAVPGEHRVALVIGNSAYKESPLRNPVNDAKDMAAKLRSLGFDVVERTNLSVRQIGGMLREFRSKLVPGAVAVVFYAGHGLQVKGENFLPAVDSEIEGEEDVSNQSLTVRQIMDVLDESRTRLNLVFLDACRNNPYSRRFRSASDGLSRVVAPSGTLISFATRPGSVAADGEGRNGLYTQHLLSAMEIPNLPVEQALKRVMSGVKLASKGRQEPWMEGSIEGDFYFLNQAQPAAMPAETPKLRQEAAGQADTEKAELQRALKAQQEAALVAAKEKAELQQSVKAQQESTDRAVQEALKRANEQAARDRARCRPRWRRCSKRRWQSRTRCWRRSGSRGWLRRLKSNAGRSQCSRGRKPLFHRSPQRKSRSRCKSHRFLRRARRQARSRARQPAPRYQGTSGSMR